ncbi:hypothetical protein C922_05228 [Plasmodium inui San Antonio 1]|uniref:Pv-fam-d protein n=1 Tax=Plasmodium inui San Antonio 1 TaxID=1237626 RepID=W6ZYG4_9APIC|nr:hypothetical protein C922_05228 [Plasmodium inui San Antonio 1]EUD64378.1 hypothetical protein C922_05228 [Plasmodium inui San Antonio 1]
MRSKIGGYCEDDEHHNIPRRMNSTIKDSYLESRFHALSSEDNLQGSFTSKVHDDDLQKRFSAIMREGDYPRTSGNSYRDNDYYGRGSGTRDGKHDDDYGRGWSGDYGHYKKKSDSRHASDLLKYDKYSGRRDHSSRGGHYMDRGHYSRGRSGHISRPPVSEDLAHDIDRQDHYYKQYLESHDTPYSFTTFDISKKPHMPLSDSQTPMGTRDIKHLMDKVELHKSALKSMWEGFIKFLKKSDAMYETEILRILEGTTGSYDGQHIQPKKYKGLGGILKDYLTILSPVISVATFLTLFGVFVIKEGIIITSIALIATMLYVWYKYKKCKHINRIYGIYDKQQLMEHSAEQKMEPIKNSKYLR